MYDFYTILAMEYEVTFYNGCVDSFSATGFGSTNNRLGSVQVTKLATTNANDFVDSGISPVGEMKHAQTKFLRPENEITFTGVLTPEDFIVDAKDADTDSTWVEVGQNPPVNRFLGFNITPVLTSSFTGQNKDCIAAIHMAVRLRFTAQFTQVNQSLRATAS